jgi:Protein of unknown function (DUF1552)
VSSDHGISRRRFLRGAGAAIALPYLDSLPPSGAPPGALTAALGRSDPPAARPTRALFVFSPNGQCMPDWTPGREGADFDLPFLLEPLAPHRSKLLVLSGLALEAAKAQGDGPGDHARGSASFLTCAHPFKTGGTNIRAGVSVDQVIAAKIGGDTRFPSLELGCETGKQAGDCDSGYSCVYTTNVSWRTTTAPATKETSPQQAFRRLFAGPDDGLGPKEADARRRQRASVLDAVLEDARSLSARLGASDRVKLDDYMTAVREVEARIQKSAAAAPPPAAEPPANAQDDYPEHVRLMYDLVALAFRADLTRVATLMVGNAGSNRSYGFLGVAEGHHHLSHHGKDADKVAKIRKINRFQTEQLARFLGTLAATADGDSTLLDRSIVHYGCAIADGDRHDHVDLPIVLAGGGNGTIAGGRHLRFPKDTPLANLYLAILDRMNVRATTFGDSTGRLPI